MQNFATKIIINKTVTNSYIDGTALSMLICNRNQLPKNSKKNSIRNLATTTHQSVALVLFLVLMLLAVLFSALPAFAAAPTTGTETGNMTQLLWHQEANTLDDAVLAGVYGKGLTIPLSHPEIIPAVVLWDESGKGRSNTGTSETIIRINVFRETANTR